MKKLIVILLIITAMYVTAKWPDRVVSGVEFGYRTVSNTIKVTKTAIKLTNAAGGVADDRQ